MRCLLVYAKYFEWNGGQQQLLYSSNYTHNTRLSKKNLIERPKKRHSLNFLRYLDPKLWLTIPEIFKIFIRFSLNTVTKSSC